MVSKKQRKWVTCGFESPSWTLWCVMTLAMIYITAIRTFMMYSLLYAVTSIWSEFSLSFKRNAYGRRSLSISSAYLHETCRYLTSLTSLAWHETTFILSTTFKSYWEHTHAHTGLLCVISIGNWAKPRPPAVFLWYSRSDKLDGVLSESSPQWASLGCWQSQALRGKDSFWFTEVRTASGSQGWQERCPWGFWHQQPTCLPWRCFLCATY